MRRYEQLSLLLADLIATHHTNYNGDGKPGFGITRPKLMELDAEEIAWQLNLNFTIVLSIVFSKTVDD
ncbi:MAG: hypothetical protein HC941_29585 [Microcoleus sp. SU_5_3]|nr:hypothetical protein [Microcoleus sp. SU_5_3]